MNLFDLRKIGLTDGELNIYNALLDLGETTRTQLAKKSGVSPSKIYDVANRLLEKGIISAIKKNGVLHFSAASPKRLQDFLDQKEAELEKERNIVTQLLPTLIAKYDDKREETSIEAFSGWEGMRTAYDDLIDELEEGDIDYIFGASAGHDSDQADRFFSRFYSKKRNKGFATKIIFNEDVRPNKVRTAIFYEKPNEIRFLHQETFSEVNFYKDVVLLVMLFKKPMVIRIKSEETANAFKKFFDTMWEQATP